MPKAYFEVRQGNKAREAWRDFLRGKDEWDNFKNLIKHLIDIEQKTRDDACREAFTSYAIQFDYKFPYPEEKTPKEIEEDNLADLLRRMALAAQDRECDIADAVKWAAKTKLLDLSTVPLDDVPSAQAVTYLEMALDVERSNQWATILRTAMMQKKEEKPTEETPIEEHLVAALDDVKAWQERLRAGEPLPD